MHWSIVRSDERSAARTIRRVGGWFTLDGSLPFKSHISSFWVRETGIEDDDLLDLGDLPRLNAIELGYTQLTDRGVAKIRDYQNLEYVFLWGTRITDRTIETLIQMPWLRLVNVSHTQITKDGFDTLRESLANCLVSHTEFGTMFRDRGTPDSYSAWLEIGEPSDQPKRKRRLGS